MKKRIFVFGVFLLVFAGMVSLPVFAQDVRADEPGVVEHLDTIIPAGITFSNDQGQPVQLKSAIKKATILALVYYDCMGVCPTLLSGVSDAIEKMAQLYRLLPFLCPFPIAPSPANQAFPSCFPAQPALSL